MITDRPKACTSIELRRVGVIFTRREQSLKCVRCEADRGEFNSD